MPDCRWVVDAKHYSASKVSAHDVDKLLSDKKSHRAEIGILMVYMDGSCSLPISPNVQKDGGTAWHPDCALHRTES